MADPPSAERDYVLGTHDAEIERLGLQHEAWRSTAIESWNRAGIARGWHVLDLGAGPGHASLDLARAVGPEGSVTAVERSGRFAQAGRDAALVYGCGNIHYRELDLMLDPLPEGSFDAAWCRWVCSFLPDPAPLIEGLSRRLRAGGVAVFHEYADYASWRYSPRLPLLEEYVAHVMRTWRDGGGEPDIAMSLPPLLRTAGFSVRSATPHIFCVGPGDDRWRWISTFVESNCERLLELGTCDTGWVESVRAELRHAEADQDALLLTPMVLEVIADLR